MYNQQIESKILFFNRTYFGDNWNATVTSNPNFRSGNAGAERSKNKEQKKQMGES